MIARWLAISIVLVAFGLGDLWLQLHKPDYKFRLTVEVDTPTGPVVGSSVIVVHRDKVLFGRNDGDMSIKGDAVFVDLGGRLNLVALLALGRHAEEPDGMNDLAQRAFAAVHRAAPFQRVTQLTGRVPLHGPLVPTLVSFADPEDPASARWVNPDRLEASLGKGFRLNAVTLEVVPVGVWPFDVGGVFGEPVSRGIEQRLPWLRDLMGRPDRIACDARRETCLDIGNFQRD